MKLLITSGGTKVPIDSVRDITNMSRGTFGAKIAEYFLSNNEVHFVKAKGSRTPFTLDVDVAKQDMAGILKRLSEIAHLNSTSGNAYFETEYRNFDDYVNILTKSLIDESPPDITILAAAVSDYGVDAVRGKIRTKDMQQIQLYEQPKLISRVKQLCPTTYLVGFKLLVDGTEAELEAAAIKQAEDCRCDVVIANDLRDIKNNIHICRVYDAKRGKFSVFKGASGSHQIAADVSGKIVELWYRRFE